MLLNSGEIGAPCGVPFRSFRARFVRRVPRGASRVAALSTFHACRRHYPGRNQPVLSSLSSRPTGGLPLITGGSASALTVSGPARRSLAFRPAWSLSRPRRPFSPECFNPCRYLHEPPWPLPAGATVAGWVSHPPGKRAFPRRTVMLALHREQLSEAVQCGCIAARTPGGFCPRAASPRDRHSTMEPNLHPSGVRPTGNELARLSVCLTANRLAFRVREQALWRACPALAHPPYRAHIPTDAPQPEDPQR